MGRWEKQMTVEPPADTRVKEPKHCCVRQTVTGSKRARRFLLLLPSNMQCLLLSGLDEGPAPASQSPQCGVGESGPRDNSVRSNTLSTRKTLSRFLTRLIRSHSSAEYTLQNICLVYRSQATLMRLHRLE